jgi:hypothetical protein
LFRGKYENIQHLLFAKLPVAGDRYAGFLYSRSPIVSMRGVPQQTAHAFMQPSQHGVDYILHKKRFRERTGRWFVNLFALYLG